jgi:hypothetical protein
MTCRYRCASLLVMAALSSSCVTSVVAQENRGTLEQQAACAPDAFRLCSSYIPDPTGVASCLRQRSTELSGACRSVFDQAAKTADPSRLSRSAREY